MSEGKSTHIHLALKQRGWSLGSFCPAALRAVLAGCRSGSRSPLRSSIFQTAAGSRFVIASSLIFECPLPSAKGKNVYSHVL